MAEEVNWEQFHQVYHGNGTFFTIPVRYQGLRPFQGDKPFVVHAYDRITHRAVVIKKVVLPDNFRDRAAWKRAQRELYCMLHIEHDNVVKLYSTFVPPIGHIDEFTEFYIVREYMEGTMKMLDPFIVDHFAIKSMFFDICRGVQYLHSMNISHRDLKPQNILLCQNGDVKLCDFGHSNVEDPNSNTPYIVQRYYRAPEIICELTTDNNKTSVDIWSLGCILAELFTGRVLFQGTDHIDQFWKIVQVLGNPDELFLQNMNRNARDFLESHFYEENQYPKSIHPLFPDSSFQGLMSQDTAQCALARDLLSKMLVINPDDRMNIDGILSHAYLADVWEDEEGVMETTFTQNPPHFLRNFFTSSSWFPPDQMREEIFSKVNGFGAEFNIYTSSKN